jgi:8-oxo-dGTP pyrophosphatase MutT (NUDIX family)
VNLLVSSTGRLTAADAAAAIILVGDRYLMQLRDERAEIWYPGHWGLFGGAMEAGEEPIAALRRELFEELELTFEAPAACFFMQIEFDLSAIGLMRYRRDVYTVAIPPDSVQRLVLHEGAAVRLFTAAEILGGPPVTPYDSFAIFIHAAQARLRPSG